MIRSVRSKLRGRGQPEIQIAPLIDMMFILLIFLLVTTTFVRETGIDVQRPQAATAAELDRSAIMIGIGPGGEVHFEGRRIDLISLRTLIEQQLTRSPESGVVLIADKQTPTEALVRVMDEAQMGGAKRIAIASRK
jgi:biopolymer transport protein ExbD